MPEHIYERNYHTAEVRIYEMIITILSTIIFLIFYYYMISIILKIN